MPDQQAPYTAMLARMSYQRPLPESWSQLLADVREFVDPLITDSNHRHTSWDPVKRAWRED